MKRIAIAAGTLALAAAVEIPVGGAFGASFAHCEKLGTSFGTASSIIGNTNSGQSTNVQGYIVAASTVSGSRCP